MPNSSTNSKSGEPAMRPQRGCFIIKLEFARAYSSRNMLGSSGAPQTNKPVDRVRRAMRSCVVMPHLKLA